MQKNHEAFISEVGTYINRDMQNCLNIYFEKYDQYFRELREWNRPKTGISICLVVMTSKGLIPIGYGKVIEVIDFCGLVKASMLSGKEKNVMASHFDRRTNMALADKDTAREQLYTNMEKRISEAYHLTDETINAILQALWL